MLTSDVADPRPNPATKRHQHRRTPDKRIYTDCETADHGLSLLIIGPLDHRYRLGDQGRDEHRD
jgi:hypothetical protein